MTVEVVTVQLTLAGRVAALSALRDQADESARAAHAAVAHLAGRLG
jgi:hypothetical protein